MFSFQDIVKCFVNIVIIGSWGVGRFEVNIAMVLGIRRNCFSRFFRRFVFYDISRRQRVDYGSIFFIYFSVLQRYFEVFFFILGTLRIEVVGGFFFVVGKRFNNCVFVYMVFFNLDCFSIKQYLLQVFSKESVCGLLMCGNFIRFQWRESGMGIQIRGVR